MVTLMKTEPDIKIALRDSKAATRPYALVNPRLAKHMPAEPSQALEYFMRLGEKVAAICARGRVLVIGFAETATAVGAAVASAIENAVYVHTTREQMPDGKLAAEFEEEHSHAKNQALYLNEEFKDLSRFDCIVFVEDEITTGKTILNFLKKIRWNGKIIISALVFNGFDMGAFSEYDAAFACVQRTGEVKFLEFAGFRNPRAGVYISGYLGRCENLSDKIIASLDAADINDKDILIAGTEEFMYPALYLGRKLEKTARSVKSHSTTRSPLAPKADSPDYPLKTRDSFASVYDGSRTTYLYNLAGYDTVIVMTDSDKSGCDELLRVIRSYGNQMIYFVRVINDE